MLEIGPSYGLLEIGTSYGLLEIVTNYDFYVIKEDNNMMEVRFIFKVSPINGNTMLEQVALALQKRTEYISRATNPKMREYTDSLNKKEKAPESVLKKRRVFRKIASLINLFLGLLLFVPGMMKPDELKIPLFLGFFAIVLGLSGLFGSWFPRHSSFIKPAKKFLKNQNSISSEENQIVFLENCVEIEAEGGESASVPYSEFEYIIEAKDILLMTFQGKVTVLKKEDLQGNNLPDFTEFLLTKEFYISLSS